MAYDIKFARSAGRNLASDNLPIFAIDAMLEFIHGDIAERPYVVGKALHGEFEGTYRAKRGPYRVRYSIDDENEVVTIHALRHRADAYYSGGA